MFRYKIVTMILLVLLCINCASLYADTDEKYNTKISEASRLKDEGKTEEALKIYEELLKEYPRDIELIKSWCGLLKGMKKYDEMLNGILYLDSVQKITDPSLSIRITGYAIDQNKIDLAMKWMERAVENGTINFQQFEIDEKFQVLKNQPKWDELIQKIKMDNVGLFKEAKNFTAPFIDGKKRSLSDLRGKIVLLDFWSIGCKPCVESIPTLREMYNKYHSKGLEIISISMNTDFEKVQKFIADNKMLWLHIFDGKGWDSEIRTLYNVQWIPSVWIIDRDGKLIYFGDREEQIKKELTGIFESN
ncbi:MAG: TlpA family protein disulfide reductase [Acidobacteria bacterium]|nr:TlpA family protein disulfide reductase [Acidobacteriota bacterium]